MLHIEVAVTLNLVEDLQQWHARPLVLIRGDSSRTSKELNQHMWLECGTIDILVHAQNT